MRDLPFNLTVINQDYIRERGVTTLMPEEAYRDRSYEWAYGDGK